MIHCRLDKAFANEDCHTLFPCSFTEYLGMIGSDYRPLVETIEVKAINRKGQFRFDKRWIQQDGFMASLKWGWEMPGRCNNHDFVSKISNCRHEIARWRKNNPPFGREKIAELQKALENI